MRAVTAPALQSAVTEIGQQAIQPGLAMKKVVSDLQHD
jgi:hypothetical protein